MLIVYIACLIITVLSLFGAASLAQLLMLRLTSIKGRSHGVLVLPADGEGDELELLLRGAELRARLIGISLCDRIIVLDNGLTEEQREICRSVCPDSELFTLCTPDELMREISAADK